jgi:hypothetical protein
VKKYVQKISRKIMTSTVLFPAKTAADHTFLDLFSGLMMKNARLNFSNSRPRAHVIVKVLTQGKQVAVKSCGYALGQTTDWCIMGTVFA